MTITGVLIDPFLHRVERVELPDPRRVGYDAYNNRVYELLSQHGAEVHTYEPAFLEDGDAIMVDECGLLGDVSAQAFFHVRGMFDPLAGMGLVVGSNDEGETMSSKLNVVEVHSMVSWMTPLPVVKPQAPR